MLTTHDRIALLWSSRKECSAHSNIQQHDAASTQMCTANSHFPQTYTKENNFIIILKWILCSRHTETTLMAYSLKLAPKCHHLLFHHLRSTH